MRDRRLQSIEAIVERQQSMPAEGDDHRLLLDRQHGRSRLSWTGLEIRRRAPSLPLGHRLLVDAVALSQSPQALLMGWTAPAPAPFLRQARCHHGPFRGAPSMRKQNIDLSAAVTVGLDLAKLIFQVHVVDGKGGVLLTRAIRRRDLLPFFEQLPPCLVGLEACGSAHHWARRLIGCGHDVRLMPPAYVKAYVRRQKNDAADAAAICEADRS